MPIPMPDKVVEIVLVDDEELVHELVKRRLRNSDVRLTCFSDELLALAYLRETKPDILLIDQRMPRLDGTDLLQELGDARPDRVYLCSGGPLPPEAALTAQRFGAQVLSKDVLVAKDGLTGLLAEAALID